jgi:glycerophosphoryl diester phosphodiesterase
MKTRNIRRQAFRKMVNGGTFWLMASYLCAAGGAPEIPEGNQPAAGAFVIQAHRGAGNHGPENTLPSFEFTWNMGLIPEADVRMTSDGVVVAFHDTDFRRVVKDAPPELRDKGVEDLTWEEVSRFDVGSYKGHGFAGQRVPRIDDVFAAMAGKPERRLYLDIKKVSLGRLVRMAREHDIEEQAILASTDYALIRRWRALSPRSATLLWMGGTEDKLTSRIAELCGTGFADISQLQIHVRVSTVDAPDPFSPSSDFLKSVASELKPRGIVFQSLPINHNETIVYHRLMDLGVQSFATDEPRMTLDAMRSHRRAER